MSPDTIPPDKAVVLLLRKIEENAPVQQVEFGYDEDDSRKWWAKARLRSGRLRMAEIRLPESEDLRIGPIQALAELGRELGLSIRIWPTEYEGKQP